mmetsp:Transcript_59285/g.173394  ORF Transcript_59285/g.173394 Transcript_59285/m.173394 type:complete len:254 (-) Transcript_59285:112-873(-)
MFDSVFGCCVSREAHTTSLVGPEDGGARLRQIPGEAEVLREATRAAEAGSRQKAESEAGDKVNGGAVAEAKANTGWKEAEGEAPQSSGEMRAALAETPKKEEIATGPGDAGYSPSPRKIVEETPSPRKAVEETPSPKRAVEETPSPRKAVAETPPPKKTGEDLAAHMKPSSPGLEQGEGKMWLVVGGLDSGGIIVRKGEGVNTPQLGRIAPGSRIEQIDRNDNRMHYKRIFGDGPDFGWVSIHNKGKALVEPE